MAGAGGRGRERLTSHAVEGAPGKRRRQRWEVEFARYFGKPRRAPSTPPPPGLRYISRGRQLHPGTWLLAASPAALSISRPTHSFSARVLTVSIGDVVYVRTAPTPFPLLFHFRALHIFVCLPSSSTLRSIFMAQEEHYVSILNFSWPQIQKFAVRFPRLSDAESFLNSVQEVSSNTMDIMPSGSDYMCEHEDSSSSQYIPSNGLQYRPDETVSFQEPTSDHRTDAPAVGYHVEPDQPVLQSPLATNINSIYSGFPEGYCGFPEGYSGSVKIEKVTVHTCNSDGEGPFPATTTDHPPEKAYILDTCLDAMIAATAAAGRNSVAGKGKGAGKEIDVSDLTRDILAGIETYVGNDSFHGQMDDNIVGLASNRLHVFSDVARNSAASKDLGVLVRVAIASGL
ncbi:poor homologous synapsis 1 protein [Hordeum vulgare]|nr:poor homologous synapsis 1 protein [Hordeum vulgare]